MENKYSSVPEVLNTLKENIAAAEVERRQLRFSYSFNKFEHGDIQVLKNDEFYSGLETYLLNPSSGKKNNDQQSLLRLCEGIVAEDIQLRERASVLLSSTMELYLNLNDQKIMLLLVRGLCNWLEFENLMLPGFAVLNRRLEEVLLWLLNNSCWKEAEEVFVLLDRIQSDSLAKSNVIKSLTGKTLQNFEKNFIIEKLAEEYLQKNEQQQILQTILHCIGHGVVVYLLNRVIQSDNKNERLDLLKLISSFGDLAVPALEDCLEGNPPWTVIRNIIYVISEIGHDENYDLIARYIGHADERIQHEMIRCVVKLGGDMMKPRLTKGLGFVKDRLKIHILHLLAEPEDNDKNVFKALLVLAGDGKTFTVHSGHDVMFAFIAILKTFPYPESVELLKKMRIEYKRQQGVERLLLHIDDSLKMIEPQIRHNLQNAKDFQDLVSFANDPVQQQLAFEKVRKTEEKIQALLRTGKLEQAGQLIYDMATASAKAKDFSVAEMLRDRLLEINPMALGEVIELGDFIDEQKTTLITSHHLEIWSELYEEMTTDEFNELYYALRQENYHKGDVIVQSGETDNNLYFLNSGYISLSCKIGGREVFLKRIQPGSVLGGDQFFSPSVWTITLRALGEIQVNVLDHAGLEKITVNYPGIEEKLRKYCQKHAQVRELLKMAGDDRREYPRHFVDLPVQNVLLDPYGNKGNRTFIGQLFDVSKQGLAFTIKISNSKNARLLLGRHIMTTILIGDEKLPQQNGAIVRVRQHEQMVKDFSVHVRLSKEIDDVSFKKISSFAGGNQ